jgi:hypothetical protein
MTLQQLLDLGRYFSTYCSPNTILAVEIVNSGTYRGENGVALQNNSVQIGLHRGAGLVEIPTIRRIVHPYDPPEADEIWDEMEVPQHLLSQAEITDLMAVVNEIIRDYPISPSQLTQIIRDAVADGFAPDEEEQGERQELWGVEASAVEVNRHLRESRRVREINRQAERERAMIRGGIPTEVIDEEARRFAREWWGTELTPAQTEFLREADREMEVDEALHRRALSSLGIVPSALEREHMERERREVEENNPTTNYLRNFRQPLQLAPQRAEPRIRGSTPSRGWLCPACQTRREVVGNLSSMYCPNCRSIPMVRYG